MKKSAHINKAPHTTWALRNVNSLSFLKSPLMSSVLIISKMGLNRMRCNHFLFTILKITPTSFWEIKMKAKKVILYKQISSVSTCNLIKSKVSINEDRHFTFKIGLRKADRPIFSKRDWRNISGKEEILLE